MNGPHALIDWLATRVPAPPRALAERIETLSVGEAARLATENGESPADRLLDAGEQAMRTVLRDGCLTREAAIELLAVDALVTYAFEASADQPERIEERAGAALARIAALAEPYDA
jgi:hypothetical protein